MKPIRSNPCIVLLVLVGMLGCSPNTQTVTNEAPTSMPSSKPEITPTKTPTITASPTETLMPTLIITPSLTPLPTLETTEAMDTIRKLLAYDVDCESPCLWGIIPGRTTLGEAQNIFNRLQHPLERGQMIGDVYSSIFGFKDGLSLTVILSVDNGYVTRIKLGIGLTNFKGATYPRPWLAYSPETLLNKYGPPSEVYFRVDYPHEEGFPIGTAWYDMVMYFETNHVIVEYGSGLTEEDNLIKACPLSDHFTSGIGIWLGEDPVNPPRKGVPLETATTLTLDEFYNLLKHGSESACFDLIKEAFYPNP